MDEPILTPEERADALRMIWRARDTADNALTYLVRCLDEAKVSGKVYARRHRIKTEEGIEEKVQRKQREKKIPYKWTDITDIVGIRLITLYRDDIADVTEIVLKALLGL